MAEPARNVQPLKLCDQDGCNEPATHAYTWDWGASGYVCAKHAAVLQQKQRNLKRHVTLTSLVPGQPSQVTQDERIRMHSQVLAANDQVLEVKERNAHLYQANQQLVRDRQHQQIELSELKAQLEDARAEIEQLTADRAQALQSVAELTNNVARLQAIVEAAETSA